MDWQWAVGLGSFVISVAILVFAALKLRAPIESSVVMKEIEDVARFRQNMNDQLEKIKEQERADRETTQDRMEKMYLQYQGRIDRLEDDLKEHMKYHLKDGRQ